jgi:hypothetical protein
LHRRNFVQFVPWNWKGVGANHCILCGDPGKHHHRYEQRAELVGNGSREHFHHSGNIHIHIRERLNKRKPCSSDDLHVDGNECLGLGHIHGKSHGYSVRRFTGDNNQFVPTRNTGRGLRWLQHCRSRRHSALHVLFKHKFELSTIA